MRLDKFLKVSRLIKRRTVANEACDAGRVLVNDKPAKASLNVKTGDIWYEVCESRSAGRGRDGQEGRSERSLSLFVSFNIKRITS